MTLFLKNVKPNQKSIKMKINMHGKQVMKTTKAGV